MFIDNFKFMSSLLSNLIGTLSKELHSDQCMDCKSCLDYISHKKEFNKELIKIFANTGEFCNKDISKFILLLRNVFTHMKTWTVGKNLMKHHCFIKRHFIVA